jgi:hypothetical protein
VDDQLGAICHPADEDTHKNDRKNSQRQFDDYTSQTKDLSDRASDSSRQNEEVHSEMMFIRGEEKVNITDLKHQLTQGLKQLELMEGEMQQNITANRKENAANMQKAEEVISAQVESVKGGITSQLKTR